MVSKATNPSGRTVIIGVLGLFAALALGGAGVRAQTTPGGPNPAASLPADLNCAVSTARIGSVDVTEFFGIRGGATGFAQNFAAPPSDAAAGQPLTLAQRCIRLEVENPAPGDLLPVGGYVMSGFAFDPTTAADQGSGISSVQVFLDDPNQGGFIVGQTGADTSPRIGNGFGLASARASAFGERFANAGFHLTVQIPPSASGSQHAVFVLALSRTGRVGSIAIPVIVGNLTPAVPTRTP
jgi:hypothetical protein